MTLTLNTGPLLKILELERKNRFNNTAVFGGLDRFLAKWAGENLDTISDASMSRRFRSLFISANYASLTPNERQKWTDEVSEFINRPNDTVTKTKSLQPKRDYKPPVKNRVATGNTLASLESPITAVYGISAALAGKFNKLGVRTIRDLLYFFPHRHIDYSQRNLITGLHEGEEQTVIANVWEARIEFLGGRRSTVADIGDESGNMRVVWFNNPYVVKQLKTNASIIISGKVSMFHGRPVFENPEWEPADSEGEIDSIHTGRLVPVYSLTAGLHPRQVRKIMKKVLDIWAPTVIDFLPQQIQKRANLMPLSQAVSQAHYPDNTSSKNSARTRLAFDELFLLQLGVLSKKRDWQASQPGNAFKINRSLLDNFTKSLPFELTAAQQRVVAEIIHDIEKPQAMSRLLQGDVGSGKTVVATIALLIAIANGYQGAMMAPTEILAEQHFNTLSKLLGNTVEEIPYIKQYDMGVFSRPIRVALLTGSITRSKKTGLLKQIQCGEINFLIGTHALIQEGVEFSKLGLVVVDEQHRFGVEQRSALRQKGYNPHMLVMTATPIPRTLALTLYGDLDLSVIDQLPPGRQIIKTKWLQPEQRESAYRFIAKQVAEGRQAFIICPLIEESEAVQAKAVTAEYERLSSEVFPDLKLGLLHGKLSGNSKDDIMLQFRAGKFHILVATPVIEVGIDVPNATVMLVESADRFGLSQLHQFRGRVGRGSAQSYCMLLAENPSEVGNKRLKIIEETQNGFILAEEDLKLRGPGEFFGTRQSGLPDLRMAKLSDTGILEIARKAAVDLFQKDPVLKKPEHALLVKELGRVWQNKTGDWS